MSETPDTRPFLERAHEWAEAKKRREAEAARELARAARPTHVAATNDGDTPFGMGALRAECEVVAAATEGNRDDVINRAAYRMGRVIGGGNLTVETARRHLAAAARRTGQPEWEIQRALRTDSTGGLIRGQAEPRFPTERDPLPAVTTLDDVVDDVDPAEAFWTARPELEHVRAFARARRSCPWAVLGVVLARVVTATPAWVVLPALVGAEASLNLFVGLVAPSGGGKGASEAAAADAVRLPVTIAAAGVGSGEGIAHLFMRRAKGGGHDQFRDAVLMQVTEIDTLAALGDRRGATLLPELRKAWSGEALGFAYADPTKALPLPAHRYRLTLVAGVQPGRAQWVLDDADGGTPQRFLWLPAVDRDAPDVAPPCPAPITWQLPAWGTADYLTGRYALPVCETARATIDAARLARLRGEGDALDGHALLTRLKVAAALALLDQRAEVAESDWALSGTVADLSERTRAGVVEHLKREASARDRARAEAEARRAVTVDERVAEAAVARVSKRVLGYLADLDAATVEAGGLSHADLRRRFSAKDREHFDEAVEALRRLGQVVANDVKGGRRWTRA